MASINVLDASGSTVSVNVPNADGRAAAATSRSVALCNEDSAMLTTGIDSLTGRRLVGTAVDRFIEHWNVYGTSPTGNWEVLGSSDIAVTGPLGGGAAGSKPYLQFSSGTTASSRTVIASRAIFKPPFDLRFAIGASQRIANCIVRVAFLECNPTTGEIITATTPATAQNC